MELSSFFSLSIKETMVFQRNRFVTVDSEIRCIVRRVLKTFAKFEVCNHVVVVSPIQHILRKK